MHCQQNLLTPRIDASKTSNNIIIQLPMNYAMPTKPSPIFAGASTFLSYVLSRSLNRTLHTCRTLPMQSRSLQNIRPNQVLVTNPSGAVMRVEHRGHVEG